MLARLMKNPKYEPFDHISKRLLNKYQQTCKRKHPNEVLTQLYKASRINARMNKNYNERLINLIHSNELFQQVSQNYYHCCFYYKINDKYRLINASAIIHQRGQEKYPVISFFDGNDCFLQLHEDNYYLSANAFTTKKWIGINSQYNYS